MAITDENIQHIQEATKDNCGAPKGTVIDVGKDGKHEYYKVVNSTNGQTQAIAVASCDKDGSNVDYSETTITVQD